MHIIVAVKRERMAILSNVHDILVFNTCLFIVYTAIIMKNYYLCITLMYLKNLYSDNSHGYLY